MLIRFYATAVEKWQSFLLKGEHMNLLEKMTSAFRIDASQKASNEQEIKQLIEFSPIAVLDEYLAIIRNITDVEINVSGKIYIRIWGAKFCIEMNQAHMIQHYIPNSLAIGDDEGENILLYTDGTQGFGLYAVGFGDLEYEEMMYIAPSLTALLTKNQGLNMVENL